jgi:hypothetical protein
MTQRLVAVSQWATGAAHCASLVHVGMQRNLV